MSADIFLSSEDSQSGAYFFHESKVAGATAAAGWMIGKASSTCPRTRVKSAERSARQIRIFDLTR